MYFKILTFLLLSGLLLSGCSHVPNELQQAEKLMDLHPDSALCILKNLSPRNYTSESDKALYQFLLYQAYDKNHIYDKPDSLIELPLNYYQKRNDKLKLAICYYFKGSSLFRIQKLDEASKFYLKSLDEFDKVGGNGYYEGWVFVNLGDMVALQQDYVTALKKYQIALNSFDKVNDSIDIYDVKICIARAFRLSKRYEDAFKIYRRVLQQTSDSLVIGLTLQDLGIYYYNLKQYDSAQYCLTKSLQFPYYGTGYAIRLYSLADSFFEDEKYVESEKTALQSLNFPASYYTRREIYRILVNCEYLKNDIKQMGKYMSQYQLYSDSVRELAAQTKSSVIEEIHDTTVKSEQSKMSVYLIVGISFLIIIISGSIVYLLYRKYKIKNYQIKNIQIELIQKKRFVSQRLIKSIEEARALQFELRKNSTVAERAMLDEELYNKCLHLENWDDFVNEMNISFNQIIERLEKNYPTITKKEIIWSCLYLIDLSNQDMCMLLHCSQESLYKLKQRLAKKFNLKNTKEIESFLNNFAWN